MVDEGGTASFAIVHRELRSERDPLGPPLVGLDIEATIVVDTVDQGSFILEMIPVLELAGQMERWLTEPVPATFEYESVEAAERALLWFREWKGGWAVGAPWAEAGPFLVDFPELVAACRRFLIALRRDVESRCEDAVSLPMYSPRE